MLTPDGKGNPPAARIEINIETFHMFGEFQFLDRLDIHWISFPSEFTMTWHGRKGKG